MLVGDEGDAGFINEVMRPQRALDIEDIFALQFLSAKRGAAVEPFERCQHGGREVVVVVAHGAAGDDGAFGFLDTGK